MRPAACCRACFGGRACLLLPPIAWRNAGRTLQCRTCSTLSLAAAGCTTQQCKPESLQACYSALPCVLAGPSSRAVLHLLKQLHNPDTSGRLQSSKVRGSNTTNCASLLPTLVGCALPFRSRVQLRPSRTTLRELSALACGALRLTLEGRAALLESMRAGVQTAFELAVVHVADGAAHGLPPAAAAAAAAAVRDAVDAPRYGLRFHSLALEDSFADDPAAAAGLCRPGQDRQASAAPSSGTPTPCEPCARRAAPAAGRGDGAGGAACAGVAGSDARDGAAGEPPGAAAAGPPGRGGECAACGACPAAADDDVNAVGVRVACRGAARACSGSHAGRPGLAGGAPAGTAAAPPGPDDRCSSACGERAAAPEGGSSCGGAPCAACARAERRHRLAALLEVRRQHAAWLAHGRQCGCVSHMAQCPVDVWALLHVCENIWPPALASGQRQRLMRPDPGLRQVRRGSADPGLLLPRRRACQSAL